MRLWMSLSCHMKILVGGVLLFFVLQIPPVRMNLLLATATKMTFYGFANSRLDRDSAPIVFSSHQNAALFTLLCQPEEWAGIHYSGVGAECGIEVESLGFVHWGLGYDPVGGRFLGGGPAAKLCPQAQVALNQQIGYERFTPPPVLRAAQDASR